MSQAVHEVVGWVRRVNRDARGGERARQKFGDVSVENLRHPGHVAYDQRPETDTETEGRIFQYDI